MKPKLTGTNKRPKPDRAEAALSLQDELAAAIHGAFEAAVEIAVREVTKLVGQATGAVHEDMRRENESLKQRLQRAEDMLDCARMEEGGGGGGGSHPVNKLLDATRRSDPAPLVYSRTSPSPKAGRRHSCTGIRGDAPRPGHSRAAHRPPETQRQHEEQRPGDVEKARDSDSVSERRGDDGCAAACDSLTKEVGEEIPRLCELRVESINQLCTELAAREHDSPTLPSRHDESTLKQFIVKQEEPEEADDSACGLDAIKVEDFSPECMSPLQPDVLEDWKPEPDIQCQDSNASLSCTRLAQDFPNIFQLPEPAPVPEDPPQVYGVHVRTGRNLGHSLTHLYSCKSCSQTFQLPSLLRRHHGQCQQKLQQGWQPPVDGSKRVRLQLYPPGCSPFCCTVCNREFNRMENLKTHLRIHTGERPYTCAVCSKCFRHSGALTRHFRIHTGEKPYVCGQCGKSYRNCGGLKFHQRSHNKQLQ